MKKENFDAPLFMNIIIKYSPDITIKSAFVRKEMSRRLEQNLREGIKKFLPKEDFVLKREFDRILFSSENTEHIDAVKNIFANTPGVAFFEEYTSFSFASFDEIFQKTLEHFREKLKNKTFRVTVKRTGFHAFTSVQLEKFVGGGLAQHTDGTVKLKDFDIEVRIAIKDETFSLLSKKISGLGGLPIFAEKRVLSLISGGFDSAVSSFLMMRKGCPTDFLFFNLGGIDHEDGVQEISTFLAEKFSYGYNPYFISVPFAPVIRELMSKKIKPKYRGILLKRCMMKVAEKVAEEMKQHAIITGESLAQVSSQTLQNLKVIEHSLIDVPLYRPLLTFNKQEIIAFTKKMGTEELSAKMPEYCGVVSDKPSTNAKESEVEFEEAKLPENILDQVFASKNIARISTLTQEKNQPLPVITPEKIDENFVLIDLREKNIFDENPNVIPADFREKVLSENIKNIPFFEIDEIFPTLNQEKKYIFVCAKGVMSASHSRLLQRKGFENIFLFPREGESCSV